ncbi:MAG: hypothetical protein KJO04_01770 [Bacteroidia bacterium]|nr:hypothetical protein [Bacteroidia bacterium]
MKRLFKVCLFMLFVFAFSCDPGTTDLETPDDLIVAEAKTTSKQPAQIGSPFGITGSSTLHRNKNGITANFKAENLYPGAYTLWWVIWNKPGECEESGACLDTDFASADDVEVEVMYAGGHVVSNNGKANISAHLNVDDASESINEDFFELGTYGGLQAGNTFAAEVHLVLRTHGPVVPGIVNEQINSYEGGCDDPLQYGPFTEYPNVVGECADIAAAVFPPVIPPPVE